MQKIVYINTFSLTEISTVAQEILKTSKSKTLCFYGEMGSGKTTLIRQIVKELGGGEAQSPTFGIVNEYHDQEGDLLAYHFDFYRLEKEEEVLDLGFEDYLNRDIWTFIEWPEKVDVLLPEDKTAIFIKVLNGNFREVKIANA